MGVCCISPHYTRIFACSEEPSCLFPPSSLSCRHHAVCYATAVAKDYYAILGISRDASPEDIKKAYRSRSLELHPDKHKGDKEAERKFKEVNEAYEVLSDPKKKQMYDQFGTADAQGFGSGFSGFNAGQGFGAGFDFSQFAQSGGFGDLFETFFGGSRGGARQRAEATKGDDREGTVQIDLRDVVLGRTIDLSVRKFVACSVCSGSGNESGSSLVTCRECGGTGQVTRTTQSFFGTIQQRFVCSRCSGSGKVPEHPCKNCSGEGRFQEAAVVSVSIPPGIEDGQTLRLRGQGDAGRQGAPAGDLYVTVEVRSDPRFTRDGDDIRSMTTISVLDALLGTEISVDTVHGSVSLKIPEGTQPAQVFRLKGKGLPRLQSSRIGDHYVTVNVEIPKKLSRSERKIVEEWRRMSA